VAEWKPEKTSVATLPAFPTMNSTSQGPEGGRCAQSGGAHHEDLGGGPQLHHGTLW